MRTKYVLLVAALLIVAIILPSGGVQSQPIATTINVDTLAYLGKGEAGEAGGAYFLPDGTILALWKGRPLILDSKSGEIIRNLDALPSGFAAAPKLSPDGTKLVTRITESQMAIWDVPSGKIIKQFNYQIGWFCFSPDGAKLYVTLPNKEDNPGHLIIIDMVTLQEIERVKYSNLTWADKVDITPDGQTLAVIAGKKVNDKFYNQLILINLNDKKNCTVVETVEPSFQSLEFSPDGKQIASLYDDGNHIYIYIYNIETKEKKYIRAEELSTLFGFDIVSIGNPIFIDSNTILFEVSNLPNNRHYHFSWNLIENRIKNYININYNQSVDIKDSTILLCNQRGVVAYLNKNAVPVNDKLANSESYFVYKNHQLEYNSITVFVGESMVYDTTGKLISYLGQQQFVVGKNVIPINQTLPAGVYLLTIKTGLEQLTYKFIVE